MLEQWRLQELIPKEELNQIVTDFAEGMGLSSGIVRMRSEYVEMARLSLEDARSKFAGVNLEEERITDPPCFMSDFCRMFRENEEMDFGCWWSDLRHADEAFRRGTPIIYRCHTGLLDCVAPIRVGNRHIANIYAGQVYSEISNDELKRRFPEYLTEGTLLPQTLLRELTKLLRRIPPKLGSAEIGRMFSRLPRKAPDELGNCIRLLGNSARLISERATLKAITIVMQDLASDLGLISEIHLGLEALLAHSKRLIDFSSGSIWLYDEETKHLIPAALDWGDEEGEAETESKGITLGTGWVGVVGESGEPVICRSREDIEQKDPRFPGLRKQRDLQSMLIVPFGPPGAAWNVWEVGSKDPDVFDDQTLNILQTLAVFAGNLVKAHRERDRLTSLVSGGGMSPYLDRAIETVCAITRADSCSIFIRKPGDAGAFLEASNGLSKGLIGKAFYNPGEGMTGWVLKKGKVLNVKTQDVLNVSSRQAYLKTIAPDLCWKSKHSEHDRTKDERSRQPFLAVPLRTQDGTILGVIRLADRQPGVSGDFADADELLLEACAEHIVECLESAQTEQRLRLLTDSAARVMQEVEVERVLDVACEEAAEALACDSVTVWLPDEAWSRLTLRSANGPHKAFVGSHFYDLQQKEGLTAKVFLETLDLGEGQIEGVKYDRDKGLLRLQKANLLKDKGWLGKYNLEIGELVGGDRPLIILRLSTTSGPGGVMKFRRHSEIYEPFTEQDEQVAYAFGAVLASAIEAAHEREKKQREEELLLRKAVDRVAAQVAHRIGNAIAPSALRLESMKILIENVPEPKLRGMLYKDAGRLGELVGNGMRIIEDVKNLTGELRLQLEEVDFRQLLQDTFDSLDSSKRRISFECPEELPSCYCDRGLIRQVFEELAQNAITMKDDGHVTIGVTITTAGTRGHQLEIVFEDNGPGVLREHKTHIFDLGFSRRPGQDQRGSGYGLYFVRRIIEVHGGEITEIGEYGKGAKFLILLPLSPRGGE